MHAKGSGWFLFLNDKELLHLRLDRVGTTVHESDSQRELSSEIWTFMGCKWFWILPSSVHGIIHVWKK